MSVRLVIRGEARCPFCEGGFTRNDPPMHYGKLTVEPYITTDSYQGIAHRMCIDAANAPAEAEASALR